MENLQVCTIARVSFMSATLVLSISQPPFQKHMQVDVRGRTVQTPIVDGSEILLSIESGEIKSNSDGKKAVQQLARWFSILERVIIAVGASDTAQWHDGVAIEHPSMFSAKAITYTFLGRVHTDGPLDVLDMDDWALPTKTGVTFLKPSCVHYVSMPM